MKLKKLIKDIEPDKIKGKLNLNIDKIVYDSREAGPNSLFICIEGLKTDGHQYINDAYQKGAKAVVVEKKLGKYEKNLTYIQVEDSRKAMAYLAAVFYNYPQKELEIIGITGTNGKTTTTYLIKSIIDNAGYKTGLIGTINVIIDDNKFSAERTTPESLDIFRYLSEMKKQGVKYVVMEVSSHALDLKRVEGIEFTVAVFTNLSQDHLDYHHSLQEYIKAKSELFKKIKSNKFAVVNIDDSYSDQILEVITEKVITYGIKNDAADLKAKNIKINLQKLEFDITGIKIGTIKLNITGKFNVLNTLAAIGATKATGFNNQIIKQGLEKFEGVPGRFELIKKGQDFAVVVDYAHTPAGMENVLADVKEFVKGNIISIFGCGGDRDQGKRPLMGKIGVKLSDYCILTSDNPRSEDPDDILNQIEAGIKEAEIDTPYEIIPDREKAINKGIKKACKNDMVIIFGKGHESTQVFKDKTIHFDDREVARKALTK